MYLLYYLDEDKENFWVAGVSKNKLILERIRNNLVERGNDRKYLFIDEIEVFE